MSKMRKLSPEDIKKITGGQDYDLDHFGLWYCRNCSAVIPKEDQPKHKCDTCQCKYCGEWFVNRSYYVVHLKAAHNIHEPL